MNVRLELSLTPEAEDGLARLAARTGRSAEAVASEAVERFVVEELSTVEGIERALHDMRQGHVVAHDRVMREIEERLNGAEKNGS